MTPSDKVICIDGKFPTWVLALYKAIPIEGCQYVIRDSTGGVAHHGGKRQPATVVYLVGLNNPISEASGQEYGFDAKRFRLLEEAEALASAHRTESHSQRCEP